MEGGHHGLLNGIGHWRPGPGAEALFSPHDLMTAAGQPRLAVHVVREAGAGRVGIALGGQAVADGGDSAGALPLLASLPPVYPEWLGDRSFAETHGVRFPYVCGEMANGIASAGMVAAMAQAGMLGFFGAAGLPLERVRDVVAGLAQALGTERAWGVNIIHSPHDPSEEEALADLLIRASVPCVSASAFMSLTPAIIRCAAAGLSRNHDGAVVRARQVFAKVSRVEIAERFMSPPPAEALRALIARGLLSELEAELASDLPIAEDITVEADSGGHTDNRPLTVLLPAMLGLRARIAARYPHFPRIRIGAAGGIGDPNAVAAAFALGADYVLTGSVNQSSAEADLSGDAKQLLCKADFADVAMAPSADMFELGIKVQVLKRGTMFAARASRLHELYSRYDSLEAIPPDLRTRLEAEIFRQPLEAVWAETRQFWMGRDAATLTRAEANPKLRMALAFRSYLGRSSGWAVSGEISRRADYQIWCGPAMGAFNRWVAGSFLEAPDARSVVQIALNLLEGAAVITRAQQLRSHGVGMPGGAFHFKPRPLV